MTRWVRLEGDESGTNFLLGSGRFASEFSDVGKKSLSWNNFSTLLISKTYCCYFSKKYATLFFLKETESIAKIGLILES